MLITIHKEVICQIMLHILRLCWKWKMELVFSFLSSCVRGNCVLTSLVLMIFTWFGDFFVAVEMPSVLLMAAMTNVQIVCFLYLSCFDMFIPKRDLWCFYFWFIGCRQDQPCIKWWRKWWTRWVTKYVFFGFSLCNLIILMEHIISMKICLTCLQVRLVRVTKRVHEAYFAQLFLSKVCKWCLLSMQTIFIFSLGSSDISFGDNVAGGQCVWLYQLRSSAFRCN